MDAVLHALNAPRRRQILSLLTAREQCAGDVHAQLGGLTFGAVSQHLGVLRKAGLVTQRRAGRQRYYRARPEALGPLREWLEGMWGDALHDLRTLAESEAETN